MNNYPNVGDGLKKMFIAAIGTLICSVLTIIPIVNLIALVAIIVFGVISLVGLFTAGKDLEGCKKAFVLTIFNLVLGLVAGLMGEGFLGTLFDIVGTVCDFLIIYFVCNSVGTALKEIGAADMSGKDESVWKLNLASCAISVVAALLALLPG